MTTARGMTAVGLIAGVALLAGCGASGPSSSATGTAASTASALPTVAATGTPAPASGSSGVTEATDVTTQDGGRVLQLPLPGGAYTPSAPQGGTDDYHCFLIDPGISADTFLTGVTVIPGNAKIVHHAILFRVPPESVAGAQAIDAKTPGRGWTCFGDTGVPRTSGNPLDSLNNAPWLSAWAPGGKETHFGHGTGVPMKAGTQIILQVHYNLLAGNGADNSGVRLRLAAPGTTLTPLETMLLPAPVELPCAPGQTGALCDRATAVADVVSRFGPGAMGTIGGLQLLCGGDPFKPVAGSTQHCDRFIDRPMNVVSVAGHMHLLGKSITVQKIAADGTATTLIRKPVWNFDDQSATVLPTPVHLVPGDRLRVTCSHDITLHDKLPELSKQPHRYVVWGEGTSDEMCLGIVGFTKG